MFSQFIRQLRHLAVLTGMIGLVGCGDSQAPPPTKSNAAGTVSPAEVFAKLRSTYANAKSYSDNAVLRQRGVSRSRGAMAEMPFTHLSLLFARPNRYAITYEDAIPSSQGATKYRVVSDGRRVRSAASQLPEQIHEAIAPHETTTDNLIPEPELRSAMFQVTLENLFPQLAMLLTPDSERAIFPRATRISLLSDAELAGAECYRLSLDEPEGTRVLWIDKNEMILRKMEIPIEGQRELLDPANQFVSFSVELDFENIVLDAEIPESAVTLEIPEGGRLVRRFIPPPPSGPSDNIGRPVKKFVFSDTQGNEVTPKILEDKITILDFWATDCAPCKSNTPVLEAAYQKLKDQEDIAFYGVSTDPKGLATRTVEKTLQSWGATFPLLRDLDKHAYYELDVHATPTLMVIGSDSRVQAMHVGVLDDADDLVNKIRHLRDGGDLVKAAKKEFTEQLKQHVEIRGAATLENSLADEKPAPPVAVSRKMPEMLKLEEIWSTKLANLSEPGGIATVSTPDGELLQVMVVDGGRAVVRFEGAGKFLDRVELPDHKKTAGFIRTIADAEGGRTHLVTGVGWQQVYLYDSNMRLLFAFPDEAHSGIGDAQFIALRADATPSVLVGYWGGRGVQAGTLEGQRSWSNRHLDHVLQVTEGPKSGASEPTIWCTSTRGTVFEISSTGKSLREFPVAGHTLISLAPPSSDSASCRGLSISKPGQHEVVAFDKDGQLQWHYALPVGEYLSNVPDLERIDLPGNRETLVAVGPEGSLHFVSADGKLIDRFDYGKYVTDTAVAAAEDDSILLVSAGNRLTAWRIVVDSAP